jgi:hypothetical protein
MVVKSLETRRQAAEAPPHGNKSYRPWRPVPLVPSPPGLRPEDGDAQDYRLVGQRPYQKADGTVTMLHVWQAACVQCGKPFECTSTSAPPKSVNRRCQTHRRAGGRTHRALRFLGQDGRELS